MKTFTELPGIPMREIYRWCSELMAEARKGKRSAPKSAEAAESPAEEPSPVERTADPSEESPANPEPAVAETAPPMPENPERDPRIKSPEERIAEFEKRKEIEGKRRQEAHLALLEAIKEPLSARIKEKYQWSDERIAQVLPSIDLIRRDDIDRLRRIVLLKPDKEGEPLPRDARKVGELVYLLEYLPGPQRAVREERPGRGRGGRNPRGRGKGPRRDGGGGSGFRPAGQRPGNPRGGQGARPSGDRPAGSQRPQGGRPERGQGRGPTQRDRRPMRPKVEIKKTLGS